jgi:hypothetical protein
MVLSGPSETELYQQWHLREQQGADGSASRKLIGAAQCRDGTSCFIKNRRGDLFSSWRGDPSGCEPNAPRVSALLSKVK